jgi:hypothetical protein
MDEFFSAYDDEISEAEWEAFEALADDDYYDFDDEYDISQRNPWRPPYQPIRHRPRRRQHRCCVYRHRLTGRIRKVCQQQHTRCASRLDRNWVLIDSYIVNNCNRCL